MPSPGHGIIEERYVEDGATVKAGQKLFRIKITGRYLHVSFFYFKYEHFGVMAKEQAVRTGILFDQCETKKKLSPTLINENCNAETGGATAGQTKRFQKISQKGRICYCTLYLLAQ